MNIDKVLDNHQNQIMDIPGVVGVGIGNKDGKPAIVVMVKQLTPELKRRLPQTLEGCPVVVEQSGEIIAF